MTEGTSWNSIWLMLLLAHAVIAAGIAYLLVRFHRNFARAYLRYWSWGFAALALQLFLESVPDLFGLPKSMLWRCSAQLYLRSLPSSS